MADQDAYHATTVGERLRQAREERGLTLDDVATQTRIPIRHLRNIEDSNWDELPAITYMVGFARSYANAVGLDGAEIGRELREQLGGATRPSSVSPEIYAPPDPARVPSRSLAWAAGILLIVLVGAWLLVIRPYLTRSGDETAQAPAPAGPATAEPQQAAPPQPAAPQNLTGQQVTLVATDAVWLRIDDRARPGAALKQGELRAGEQYQVPLTAQQPVIRTSRPQVVTIRVGDRELGRLGQSEGMIRDVSLLANDLAASISGQGQGSTPAAPTQNSASAPIR